jgi:hypothetical protein
MSILRDWEMAMVGTARRHPHHRVRHPCEISQACVLYVETPRFVADRINAALGATAGILPDQPNIIATAD